MVKVKICGVTNLEDALAALFSGADAIGFVFYKNSPRFIEPLKARNISRILPKKILRAGVFVNAPGIKVKQAAKLCNLDILQFHGDESPGYCGQFPGYKVVKAFKVAGKIDLAKIKKYQTYGCLFDAFSKNQSGGTGKKFNWNLLKNIDKISGQVFLAGGLNSRNVKSAVKRLRPDWVDASSSLESRPGKKDHKKIQQFVKAAK